MYVLKHSILATLVASSLVTTSFATAASLARPLNVLGTPSLCNKGFVHLTAQRADVLMKHRLVTPELQNKLNFNNKILEGQKVDRLQFQQTIRLGQQQGGVAKYNNMGKLLDMKRTIVANLKYNLELGRKIEEKLAGMGNKKPAEGIAFEKDDVESVLKPSNPTRATHDGNSLQTKNLLSLLHRVKNAIKNDETTLHLVNAKLAKEHKRNKPAADKIDPVRAAQESSAD